MTALLGVDDGIFSGSFTLADIFFLIAAIVFGIAFVIRLLAEPKAIDWVCVAAGLMCLALGWLVL